MLFRKLSAFDSKTADRPNEIEPQTLDARLPNLILQPDRRERDSSRHFSANKRRPHPDRIAAIERYSSSSSD